MSYFSIHNHSHKSNFRLLDSINRPEKLIDRAVELNLKGACLTDHEVLSGHLDFYDRYMEIKKDNPEFKIGLGNEIYLVDKRTMDSQKYFHFLLIAKNNQGLEALRKLSSTAWYYSYYQSGMERTPTLYAELEDLVKDYPNSLIATTACLGGRLPFLVSELIKYEKTEFAYTLQINETKRDIKAFIEQMISFFGDDFYIEVAPGESKEQIEYNQRVISIANSFHVKVVVATDSHFLKKEDRFVHSRYLNSQHGEREVDAFYKNSYMMSAEEVSELLSLSYDKDQIEKVLNNTLDIYDKIEEYQMYKDPEIPLEEVPKIKENFDLPEYKHLQKMLMSDNDQDLYWVKSCLLKLKELDLWNDEYLSRLDIEADVILFTSKRFNKSLTGYFNTIKSYIELFWECGSIVGPGRGSAVGFLCNFLQEIVQIDPIKYNLPWFRFLNKERVELPDIDIDLAPSKRPEIFKAIRERKGELGILQIATFGTESTKSTILSACRGYSSKEFPDGIDVEIAQYLTSLIPSFRGFLPSLQEVIYGNPEKDLQPIKPFIQEVKKYDGLLEVMLSIENLVNKRSSHSAGVVFFNDDFYKTTALMRTPSGDLVTQYSLAQVEKMGSVKFDFLVTEISDKMIACLDFLEEDGLIEKGLTLKEKYYKYLHPDKLDLSDERIWNALANNEVLDCFQFNTPVGVEAARLVRPKNIKEMTSANSLMRLMAEQGKESALEKYVKHKKNPQLWEREMESFSLTKKEKDVIRKYYADDYGVPPYQESIMFTLMDPEICNFSLGEANMARKIVAKKTMDKIPELKELIFTKAASSNLAEYVWHTCVLPQLGYAFSRLHSLAYSFVGIQTLYLATNYPSIYWNTSCLVVSAGVQEEIVLEKEVEDDNEDQDKEEILRKKKAAKSSDYAKIATALSKIAARGIKISPPNVNTSYYNFKPDAENNQILYGLSCITSVGKSVVEEIILKRPYSSMSDLISKVKINKTAILNLIKSGAFDAVEKIPREEVMKNYILTTSDLKNKLTLQNMNGLIDKNLIPENLSFQSRVYKYTKILRKDFKKGDDFILNNEKLLQFYEDYFDTNLLRENGEGFKINQKLYDKNIYQKEMDKVRVWLKKNHDTVLNEYNSILFTEEWMKYCEGTISSWEMHAMSYYYHEHELAHVDKVKYGISNFSQLPEVPVVDFYFKKGKANIPIYKLDRIVGTVISKDKLRSSINLLTPEKQVVQVKFRKEYYALFDKQISEKQSNGTKKIVEKSWFNKGRKIVLTGYRNRDAFIPKTYASTEGHTLYLIENIDENGQLKLRSERWGSFNEE